MDKHTIYIWRYNKDNKFIVLDKEEVMDECIFETLSQYIRNPEHLVESAWEDVDIEYDTMQSVKEYLDLGYKFWD